MTFLSILDSPLGKITIKTNEEAIIALDIVSEESDCEALENSVSQLAKQQLLDYLKGNRASFDVPIAFKGTDFQISVWKALLTIPYGETRSYQEIANQIKNPKACRAVGGANNRNPIAIIVPCHRVIGKNGKMVGYATGIEKKEWLLKHETMNKDQNL